MIVLLSGILGGLIWVLDTLIDFFTTFNTEPRPFFDLLLFSIPDHELYQRLTAVITLFSFGIAVAIIIQMNQLLNIGSNGMKPAFHQQSAENREIMTGTTFNEVLIAPIKSILQFLEILEKYRSEMTLKVKDSTVRMIKADLKRLETIVASFQHKGENTNYSNFDMTPLFINELTRVEGLVKQMFGKKSVSGVLEYAEEAKLAIQTWKPDL